MNIAKKYLVETLSRVTKTGSTLLVMTVFLMNSFRPQLVAAETFLPSFFEQPAPVVATFPIAEDRAPRKTVTVVATAYNSLPWQTDSTPFITASGTHTRHGVVAANFLRIGTRVRFPDVYGDAVFTVEDRMNVKYNRGRVDIWMEGLQDARVFGAKRLKMEVF